MEEMVEREMVSDCNSQVVFSGKARRMSREYNSNQSCTIYRVFTARHKTDYMSMISSKQLRAFRYATSTLMH